MEVSSLCWKANGNEHIISIIALATTKVIMFRAVFSAVVTTMKMDYNTRK